MTKKKYQDYTLTQYARALAERQPVPGGGSAAALTALLGVSLIEMVTRYSMGRKGATQRKEQRLKRILEQAKDLHQRLLALVDLDAEAYLDVVAARALSDKEKKKALKAAAAVPAETARWCRKAVDLTPFLVKEGNPYLLSDIEVALELLWAAYRSAMMNVEANQS